MCSRSRSYSPRTENQKSTGTISTLPLVPLKQNLPTKIHEEPIAKDNVDAASRYLEMLYSRFELLCHQPGIGRKRDEVVARYRSITEGDYVIFYQSMADDTLEIKRVIRGKRDLGKALKD
jgi:toxin ParE1/3/4